MQISFGAKYDRPQYFPIYTTDIRNLQEEPLNNGAWTYVGPRIYTAANSTEHHKGKYPYYAGRGPTSSVATGSKVFRRVDNTVSLAEHDFFRRCSIRRKLRHSWTLPLLSNGQFMS